MGEVVTLDDVCELIVDCKNRTPPECPAEEAYGFAVGTPNIRDGRIVLESAKRVNRETFATWTARAVPQAGDLIVTREAPVGRVGIIPEGVKICLGQRTMLLRANAEIVHPRFLHYLLMGPDMQQAMHALSSGSTVPHLKVGEVRNLKLPPLPSLMQQRMIGELLGALDDKIAVNERIAQTALELGTAIYAHRASSAPTWRSVSLADAAQWYSGGTPRTTEPAYWNGHIPWISAISLKSPWIDDSPRKLTSLGAANGTRIVPPGTIIFVVRGSSLKEEFRIGIAQCEVAFGQDCKALVAVDGIDHDLLFHAIRHHTADILELVDETSIGAGRLATDLIEKLLVRVPDTPSDATVDALKSLNQSAAAKQRESRTLAELRDTLLPKLISGELRVRDAEKAVEEAL